MAKGLKLAEPPKRRPRPETADVSSEAASAADPVTPEPAGIAPTLFAKQRETDKVQFNKRIDKAVADGYGLLAIRTGKKIPDLLREGLEELERKYGKP